MCRECIWAVIVITFASTGAYCEESVPGGLDFFKFIDQFLSTEESFRISTLRGLDSESKSAYLRYSRSELENMCGKALWNFGLQRYGDAQVVFVACSQEKDVQARFAASAICLNPLLVKPFTRYYLGNDEEYIDWVARLSKEFHKNYQWTMGRAIWIDFISCTTQIDDEKLAERAFWSILLESDASKEDIESVNSNQEFQKKEFWAPLVSQAWAPPNATIVPTTLKGLPPDLCVDLLKGFDPPYLPQMRFIDLLFVSGLRKRILGEGSFTKEDFDKIAESFYGQTWKAQEDLINSIAMPPPGAGGKD